MVSVAAPKVRLPTCSVLAVLAPLLFTKMVELPPTVIPMFPKLMEPVFPVPLLTRFKVPALRVTVEVPLVPRFVLEAVAPAEAVIAPKFRVMLPV